MSLVVQSTGFHFHQGSEPNFAMTTAEHPQGAWVIAKDAGDQQSYYDAAKASLTGGFGGLSPMPMRATCDRYEDSGNDRRFYWGVKPFEPIGISLTDGNDKRVKSLPPLSSFVRCTY